MKDFTEKDWEEVCKNIHRLTPKENIELYEKMCQTYPLNEMEYNKNSFTAMCGNMAGIIHHIVINICCLSDNIGKNDVNHWKSEILEFSKKIVIGQIEKEHRKLRTEIVFKEIIEPYMNTHTYMYEDTYMYEQAMKAEIDKAKKEKIKSVQANYIQKNIIPKLSQILEVNNDRVSVLFKEYIRACKETNIEILEEALNNFINTKVAFKNYTIHQNEI